MHVLNCYKYLQQLVVVQILQFSLVKMYYDDVKNARKNQNNKKWEMKNMPVGK